MKKFNLSLTNFHEWALGGFALEYSRYTNMEDEYTSTYFYMIRRRDNKCNIEVYKEDNSNPIGPDMVSEQHIRSLKFLTIELVKESFVNKKQN